MKKNTSSTAAASVSNENSQPDELVRNIPQNDFVMPQTSSSDNNPPARISPRHDELVSDSYENFNDNFSGFSLLELGAAQSDTDSIVQVSAANKTPSVDRYIIEEVVPDNYVLNVPENTIRNQKSVSGRTNNIFNLSNLILITSTH